MIRPMSHVMFRAATLAGRYRYAVLGGAYAVVSYPDSPSLQQGLIVVAVSVQR